MNKNRDGTGLVPANEQMRFANFIAGEFVPPAGGNWFAHLSPNTGAVQGQVAASGLMDVVRALQAANQANLGLQRLDRVTRIEMLEKWLHRLAGRIEDFAKAQSLEQGSTLQAARSSSQHAIQNAIRCLASVAQFEARVFPHSPVSGSRLGSRRQVHAPLGVVAILSSWMDPVETILTSLLPALVAGNSVILKTSEFAPQTAQLLAEVFAELLKAGDWSLPWVQILQGKGEDVGAALIAHPGIHTIAFTGRNETARHILRVSSEDLKRTHFALGARNPVLIFQETDLEQIVPEVIELCVKQTGCKRGSRIFVQESIYKPFLEAFKVALEGLRIGDSSLESTELGPLVSRASQTRYNEQVAFALSERAKLLNSAPLTLPEEGFFVAPKALFDLTYCSTIQQEELIGPVVTITSFKYQHDALKHAGNSPYGLIGYVFCDDKVKAANVAEKLDVSKVIINANRANQNLDDQSLSHMGLRQSGLGGGGFAEMIRFFSRETAIFGD